MASGLLKDYIGTGPASSRPASPDLSSDTAGFWWDPAGSGTLYAWDGSSWDTVSGGGGSPFDLDVQDDGVSIETLVDTINFTGAGVIVTNPGTGQVNVAIAGGGGGGSTPPALKAAMTGKETSDVSTATVTFPTGAAAGDLCVIMVQQAYAIVDPNGWFLVNKSNQGFINGAIYSRILNSADITAGSVVVTAGGGFKWTWGSAVYDGPGRVGLPPAVVTSTSGATSVNVITDGSPTTSNPMLYYGAARINGTASCDKGTAVSSQATSDGTCTLYQGDAPTDGGFTAGFTFSASGSGYYCAALAIEAK